MLLYHRPNEFCDGSRKNVLLFDVRGARILPYAQPTGKPMMKNVDARVPDLRKSVCAAYSAAARTPFAEHAFPVGREFALSLGYPADVVNAFPAAAVDAFTGVSNVARFAQIPKGAVVLDLGCGAGLDSLIAARRAGDDGRVVGVDFSSPMLARARQSAREAAIGQVVYVQADAEQLPLADRSIDVALVNGIFNLNLRRSEIFGELGRVMREDGAVYAAELILREPLPPDETPSEADWFA